MVINKTISLVFLFFGILVSAVATYYVFSHNSSPMPIGTTRMDKIRIANIGEFSIFNLIAKDQGFFAQNGLDAQVDEYSSGPTSMGALTENKDDFAVAADFVGGTFISTNKDLRILSQASKHDVFRMIARKDKGIYKPSDLKGKTIGVTRKGVGEFFMGEFLTSNDISLSDVKIVDLMPNEMVTQIENGQIDAVVIFDPHSYNIQKMLGDKIIMWSVQQNKNAFAVVFTTKKFIDNNPDIVDRYMKSLIQAEQFLNDNPDKAKQIIEKAMNYDSDYVDYMWPNFEFRISLDQTLLLNLESEAKFRINNKLTNETSVPNYLDYIYFNTLQTLKPEAISIIH